MKEGAGPAAAPGPAATREVWSVPGGRLTGLRPGAVGAVPHPVPADGSRTTRGVAGRGQPWRALNRRWVLLIT